MTSNVRQHVHVACPAAEAKRYLEAHFDERGANRGVMRLSFSVPLVPGAGEVVGVRRVVTASIEPLTKKGDGSLEAMRVRWEPDGGPFPSFEGTLEAEREERYDSLRLSLSGAYEPPFGVAGTAFDTVLGKRIAATTAHRLLLELAERIEQDYLRCEQLKRIGQEADRALRSMVRAR